MTKRREWYGRRSDNKKLCIPVGNDRAASGTRAGKTEVAGIQHMEELKWIPIVYSVK